MATREIKRRKFYTDQTKHELYKRLVETKTSPFYKKTMKDIFILSAAMGYYYGVRKPLGKRRDIADILVFTEVDWWILNSIAFATIGDLRIITDRAKVLDIAEEYANWGIDLLYDLVIKSGVSSKLEVIKNLDLKISEIIDKILKVKETE